ncbi:MAG: bifunctional metallophosphatase/5'-nucleotidase, partial [Armatimonadetes bacterium]|nr:bifunctional metallophosphatase/5'-nucleotidase [Armatimonadota bacterium]
PQADVLIALTHIGIREDERLAAACQGLHLIVGGHSHVTLTAPEVIGRVPIAQAGWFGHYLGRVTLGLGAEGRVASVTGQLESLKA